MFLFSKGNKSWEKESKKNQEKKKLKKRRG